MASYTQLRKPNLDPVIYQEGKALLNWLGWCLAYVQFAFGTGWAGTRAWYAWTDTVNKHTNRSFPKRVYFPIWFSHYGTYGGVYGNFGHVAICYVHANGKMQIWTSPISNKPFADVYNSIAEIERLFSAKYVGWSEDLAGIKLIEKTKAVTKPKETNKEYIMKTNITGAQWRQFVEKVYLGFTGRNPSKSETDFHLKNSNPLSFVNGFASFKWKSLEKDVASLKKDKAVLQKQVTDLSTALKKAQAQLDKDVKHVPADQQAEIDRLKAENAKLIQQAQSTTDKINNAYYLLGGWLAKVISLFKRG